MFAACAPTCRHQDAAYWPPLKSDTSAANCWLALSNVTKDNGCLRYVPGSHLEPQLRRHRPGASKHVHLVIMIHVLTVKLVSGYGVFAASACFEIKSNC
jgi:ectoine hydroxylase-related dioxygenase (phytanoyl-CoA dioxygenase family)